MLNRLIGSIFLIIGTAIGGGLLALPMVTSGTAFTPLMISLACVWIIMALGALQIVTLCCQLGNQPHLISIARVTLGRFGVAITWVCYLLLLYSLISLYLAGGTDIIQGFLQTLHWAHSPLVSTLIFFFLFALIFYQGARHIDWFNRIFMIAKLIVFVVILGFLLNHIQPQLLIHHPITTPVNHTWMPIIFSFGFGTVVPSIVLYLSQQYRPSRNAVLIGCCFPLVIYVLWIIAVQGTVSSATLTQLSNSQQSISGLSHALAILAGHQSVGIWIHFFTTICITTSFLGVSLSLLDFLMDGLKKAKRHNGTTPWLVMMLAFLPPLLVVWLKPGIFITLLKYAGVLCVLLLILLPTAMMWQARYRKKLLTNPPHTSHWFYLLLLLAAGVTLMTEAVRWLYQSI